MLLLLYRLLWLLLTPLALLLLLWRLLQGKEDPSRIQERLGWPTSPRPPGPLLWFHAASVGELNSLLPVFAALQELDGGIPVLLTTVTRSSARLAPSVLPPGVIHQYVPIDHWLCWLPFRLHWRPSLGVLAEAELWPEIVHAMPRLQLINARMSAGSFRNHQRLGWFATWVIGRAERCFAQSEQDAERFRRLGAQAVVAAGSTKRDAAPLAVSRPIVERLGQVFGRRPVVLLASSHAGEEQQWIEAWLAGSPARQGPGAIGLLIAPRHPQRSAQVLELARAAFSRQKAKAPRAALWTELAASELAASDQRVSCDLVVADCIGAMGSWIGAASVVVMGGSFYPNGRPHGGQNPLEPAALAKPVVCGPDMANFSDVTAALAEAGVLHQYPTASQAFDGVVRLLEIQRNTQRQGPNEGPPMVVPAGVVLHGPSRQIATGLIEALAGGAQPPAQPLEPSDR
jgi:3-deoxy-D-manno-octulosonic-acid transferase